MGQGHSTVVTDQVSERVYTNLNDNGLGLASQTPPVNDAIRKQLLRAFLVQSRDRVHQMQARECLTNVESVTSPSDSNGFTTPLQFNHAECECLIDKLKEAVQDMEAFYDCDSYWDPYGMKYPKNSEYPEYPHNQQWRTQLLWRCAKEVERLIEGCCIDNRIQAAMVLPNVTEHVSQLISDLESCICLFRRSSDVRQGVVTAKDSLPVEGRVSWDRSDRITVLTRLEPRIRYPTANPNDQESQLLAQCLEIRLRRHLSQSVQVVSDWEIPYSSLKSGQKLGAGASGEVRKSSLVGVDVAEKLFIGSDHSSFMKEVEILAGLTHPNIVPFIGYAIDRNVCCIVMELMDGDLPSLMRDTLRQNNTLEVPFSNFEAVNLMLQTAQGMRYLHEKRVVHRDLKAQNILVKSVKDSNGVLVYIDVKVADFGLSKTKDSSVTYSNQSLNIGSTGWMAPELMLSREDVLEPRYPFKVDVYSFGMVCYEILTGEVPFPNISNGQVRRTVLSGDRPELPHQCPDALKALICSCWEADPSSRPSFIDICERLRCLKYTELEEVEEETDEED